MGDACGDHVALPMPAGKTNGTRGVTSVYQPIHGSRSNGCRDFGQAKAHENQEDQVAKQKDAVKRD